MFLFVYFTLCSSKTSRLLQHAKSERQADYFILPFTHLSGLPTLLPPIPQNTTIKCCMWGKDGLTVCLLTIPMAITCRCFNSVLSIKGRRVSSTTYLFWHLSCYKTKEYVCLFCLCDVRIFFPFHLRQSLMFIYITPAYSCSTLQ